MARNKYRELYTYDEAMTECKKYHDKHGYDNGLEIFIEQGFECLGHFLKLEDGWCPSHEEICGYCVHSLVQAYGSRNDRLKYNERNDMSGRYGSVPITAKEIAINNKKSRKRSKGTSKAYHRGKVANRIHQRELKKLRNLGVNILRRGKHNISVGLYEAILFTGEDSVNITIPIPGYEGTQFQMVGDVEEAKAEIRSIVDGLNGESGSPDLNKIYSTLDAQVSRL